MNSLPRISGFWAQGMNSLDHPVDISDREYAYGENVVNRGGIVQTRPGFQICATLPGSKLQGIAMFRPLNGLPRMMVAVDGLVYAAMPPFETFDQIQGISFSDTADFIIFQKCTKSVKRNSDGSLELLTEPYELMVMQDGLGAAAYWDGGTARHLRPEQPFLETPPGTWMAWSGSRLWIADKTRIYASDLADPLSFSESIYLAERANFELPGECTGLIETVDRQSLLAFTPENTTAFQSGIMDRTQWQLTPEFQKIILPDIGSTSGLSPCTQYGATFWHSRRGWVSLDSAFFSEGSSKILSLDQRMMRSKRTMHPKVDKVCAIAFENFLICSMPSGDRYNAHMWVMDQAPVQGQDSFCWAGVWSGIRPIQWAKTTINGRERLFAASYGKRQKDGNLIHIWEAFRGDRKDQNGRILCQMESGAAFWPEKVQFRYAELDLVEVLGDVHLEAYVAGMRGAWHKVLDVDLQAEIGSLKRDETITAGTIIKSYKPQTRILRTETLTPQDRDDSDESLDTPGIDKAFQLLFQWRGRMGIRGYRMVVDPAQEAGAVGEAVNNETGPNIVTERGESPE